MLSVRVLHASGEVLEPVPPADKACWEAWTARPLPGRRREIDNRLDAVRARLKKLRERDWDAVKNRTAARGERLEAAQRHAAEAYAAAAKTLASSAEAFRRAAEAHERVASVHERAAASGIGDVRMREQQAALHRAAAVADRQRAERALSLLSEPGWAAPVSDEPRDGVAP
jgi:hypothetical protein